MKHRARFKEPDFVTCVLDGMKRRSRFKNPDFVTCVLDGMKHRSRFKEPDFVTCDDEYGLSATHLESWPRIQPERYESGWCWKGFKFSMSLCLTVRFHDQAWKKVGRGRTGTVRFHDQAWKKVGRGRTGRWWENGEPSSIIQF